MSPAPDDPEVRRRPSHEELAEFARELLRAAPRSGHRRALVLSGGRDWPGEAALACLRQPGLGDCLWITDTPPRDFPSVPARQARRWLGRELDALVFDARGGFDPDAFGAVSGAVRGGGLLLLLTPPLAEWPQLPDPEHARIAVFPEGPERLPGRFVRRLAGVIRTCDGIALVEEGGPLPPATPHPEPSRATPAAGPALCGPWRTEDQRLAVTAVERVARGHRRRPLVLTSDRGRGKSAAFGIAAARLMDGGRARILVTGPRLEAVRPVLRHAAALLPGARADASRVASGSSVLEYRAPDALVRERPLADLLLVDEAAALPLPVLERLLERYARIAFATTVHGYEGSGRGFTLRFHRTLDRETPGWHALRLDTPVRWAPEDPVERFVFRALLLDAEPPGPGPIGGPEGWEMERVDRDALAADEAELSGIFGLLVLAHYRTRPFDLRQLLDGPALRVYALREAGRILATALVAREGALPSGLAPEIRAGRRRVRGHLIPQSMEAHLGLAGASGLAGDRIMRIAVHPQAQRRGMGTRLLRSVLADAQEAGRDWVGTSFGATPELLAFWRRAGLSAVRIGFTREAASGSHSVMMLRGVSRAGRAMVWSARTRFLSGLPHQLSGPLRDLDPILAAALLRRRPDEPADGPADPLVDPQDRRELTDFAYARRGYEDTHPALWRLTVHALSRAHDPLDGRPGEAALLVRAVLMKHPWAETARAAGLPGRGAVVDALRGIARHLIEVSGPPR